MQMRKAERDSISPTFQKARTNNSVLNLNNKNRDESPEAKKASKKLIEYSLPGINLGTGKFGQIDLIIYKRNLRVLKRIPKISIDRPKRIEHIKNERALLFAMQDCSFIVDIEDTFTDFDSVNFILEYLPG